MKGCSKLYQGLTVDFYLNCESGILVMEESPTDGRSWSLNDKKETNMAKLLNIPLLIYPKSIYKKLALGSIH